MPIVDCPKNCFNFSPMKRPVFQENSRQVRSSDLFKYLLQNEKDQATKASQKRYKKAMFKDFRWIDTDRDLEWGIYLHNEANLQALRAGFTPPNPKPFWPTL